MKTDKQWIAALCMIAMAGCASDKMNSDPSSTTGYTSGSTSTSPSSSSTSSPSSSASSTGSNPVTPMTSSSAQTSSADGSSTSSAQTSYGVVQAIDQMQRQDVGVGMAGAAAVGGSVGMPTDKVYRVTVRLDDGSNQMVVVDSMPSYKIGDRVRYSNGMLTAY